MSALRIIAGYEFRNVIRSKWAVAYAVFFFLLTDALFRFSGDSSRVILSLVSVTLLLAPLVSILFGSMSFYNGREFIELTLTQPVSRKSVFAGMYLGLSSALALGFIVGLIVPFLIHGSGSEGFWPLLLTLLVSGVALTCIFVGLAFLLALLNEDRGKGLGKTILLWLWFTALYDGLILLIIVVFSKYPLEKAVLALTALNPIDLARTLLLLQLDISALMGYTGAVYENFFGSIQGALICWSAILVWVAGPLLFGLRRFNTKDF